MGLMITTLLLFIQRGFGEIFTFSIEWKCHFVCVYYCAQSKEINRPKREPQ
ncbi:hypothetical protein M634_06315 [Vibrio parahaemolyticus O1:Kuk str. FDA_R31]|nr:hypothetical protein M634_06315 [Vibrio parahaemolyticus O1:Kuk str. FDA_R31]ALG52521.1 hypothetical protein FORC6_2195 [Vibrio parahaemolyticus]ETZ08087.1 hypothetical protein AJ90_02195 [Vibrio parahaemolyticus M0605]KIT24086.1 hypothetical protein H323_01225 [Vibrio parahaemolyticus VP766]KIT41543.1 hypothetical protein H320_17925 [Vibrio parahaemolyticus 49]PIS70170.1 hypothetical protein H271_12995 [Vibrio parahaemolyticus 1911C]